LGDFNDILSPNEKKGRNERANWLISGFRRAVQDAGLVDVHMEGYAYTWFKSLGMVRAVEERLDRALATDTWSNLFPNAILENLPAPSSDHCPIMLLCDPGIRGRRMQSRFKFENAWLLDPNFSNYVKEKWSGYGAQPIADKLDMCAMDLLNWNRNHFQQFRRDIDDCRKKLDVMRGQVDCDNVNSFNSLRNRMNQLLVQEDAFWRPRAKTHWLRDEDLNTKFFHVAASSRRKVNRITSLIDVNNNRVSDEDKLCEVARDYFVDLFQAQNSDIQPIIDVIHESISLEDNTLLTAPFVIDEFKEAIFSMKPDKCPRPDGFNPGFCQKFWGSFGEEIFSQCCEWLSTGTFPSNLNMTNIEKKFFSQCCEWLSTGTFPSNLNMTNIALIPKGDSQVSMKDWRPIALCNVVYKIVAKVLANRLKLVLDKCISDSQSAFVSGRSILDNAMVAIEIIHYMKSKVKGKKWDVALKLDISKAYDRIDWSYLQRVMTKMEFSDQWVKWIMMCVETVDYSVLVNGNATSRIISGRGLRQGDPLSPYLFIICVEGLSALIRKAEARGEINGVKICNNAPIISHLLFVDDCFLFFRANVD